MSANPYDPYDTTFDERTTLTGPSRPSTNPRLHSLSKHRPYSRPASFAGPSSNGDPHPLFLASPSSPAQNHHHHHRQTSPTKPQAHSTRIPRSGSGGSLTRSESDSGLFSSLKSVFSRPLQWLATPSRAADKGESGTGKRDRQMAFGIDPEDPESPAREQGKRKRPGEYDPEPQIMEVQGRAVGGFMIPPLPPHISLSSSKTQARGAPGPSTNFSRPLGGGLSSSKSMPYLDPPGSTLGSPRGKAKGLGMLTRSRRMELVGFGEEEQAAVPGGKGKGKETHEVEEERMEGWSPWKGRAVGADKGTPSRRTPSRDFTLPSLSPFKPPASPSAVRRQTPSTTGLGRSNTLGNLQRATSVMSDVSMGSASARRGVRPSSSMLFSSMGGLGEEKDEQMSVDGDAAGQSRRDTRDGSVLDWFMKERWSKDAPGSPASVAASRRLGSAAPSGVPPIRKGQLVWDADKGFVRESELRAEQAPKPVHQNDAERILFALESIRKTPLTDARQTSTSTLFGSSSESLPASLIGSSSRQIRKAINVPLATAQAGDSAKHRRDRERLGPDGQRVSVMISPYGRRREVDKAEREARRAQKAADAASDYVPSSASNTRSPSAERHSDRSSRMSADHDMEPTASLSPGPTAPTPRRSSRLNKRQDGSVPNDDEQTTPKARRTAKGKAPASIKKAAIETTTPKGTPRRTRKTTAERATSPEQAPPVPSVPTITETAPSPQNSRTHSQAGSSYQPGQMQSGGSSLRARTELTKRTHTGAASLTNSRATSPSSGRYSAREEDLPPMEELEQAKIPLNSFSGIKFGQISFDAPAATPEGKELDKATTSASSAVTDGASLNGRLGPPPAEQQQQQQPKQTLGVPSSTTSSSSQRLSAGPLSRLNASRPRASSPLASGSYVAEPESPPTSAPPPQANSDGFIPLGSTTSTALPPSTSSLFGGIAPASDAPKKSLGFGFGKPPAPTASNATPAAAAADGLGVPDFFGRKSAPASGTTTPVAAAPSPFNFGQPAKPAGEVPVPAAPLPTFSFGKPAANGEEKDSEKAVNGVSEQGKGLANQSGFSFGKPASEATGSSFSFASKPAEAAKSSFSFGQASAAPAPLAAETPKPAFSFGAPAAPAPAAESTTPKPAFSFGSSSAKPAEEASKSSFAFGAPTANAPKPATEAPKSTFSFGAAAPASTPPASSAGAASAFGGGFSFNKPAAGDAAKPAEAAKEPSAAPAFPGSNGFSFGAPKANGTAEPPKSNPFGSATPASSTAPSFAFGQSSSTPQANGTPAPSFGAKPASTFSFGATAPAANPFGSPSSQPAQPPTTPSSTFTFGANAPSTPATANPFGSSQSSAAAAPSTGFNFAFGATNPATTTTPTTAPAAAPSFAFGAPAPAAPSTPTSAAAPFSFGASTTTPTTTPSTSTFAFGQQPAAASAPSTFAFGSSSGQSPAPRFGSPAPPASPAGGGPDGGFSLGLGTDAQAPGSPSGRRIKPLRRGAVKR